MFSLFLLHLISSLTASCEYPQVEALTGAGILVVGHIGLTPQTASAAGGFRLQGKNAAAASDLLRDALALQAAGVCMIVLEMVPAPIARFITAHLKVQLCSVTCPSSSLCFCCAFCFVLIFSIWGYYIPRAFQSLLLSCIGAYYWHRRWQWDIRAGAGVP